MDDLIKKKQWKKYKEIFDKVSKTSTITGIPSYVVGGFVRDLILDRENDDIDIVVRGNGPYFAKKFAELVKSHADIYKTFGTAKVDCGGNHIEFVGARKEVYKRGSRKPKVEKATLKEDLFRRDFTINAMAISLNNLDYGKLIDFYGGVKDLKNKIIRTPDDPEITFYEDPLRILRMVRFACQLGFVVSDRAVEAAKNKASGLKDLSVERVRDEFNKMILSPNPGRAIDCLMWLGNSEFSIMNYYLPELTNLALPSKGDKVAHKNHYEHSLAVLQNVCAKSDNLWLRWAALLHDIGKGPTERYQEGGTYTYHDHENVGADMVEGIFRRLHLPLGEPLAYVQKMVRMHMRLESIDPETVTDAAVRRLLHDAGENDWRDLLLLISCDITSKNVYKRERSKEKIKKVTEICEDLISRDIIRLFKPVLAGKEIMEILGLQSGGFVGELKQVLIEAIIDGKVENEYEPLKALLLEEYHRRELEGNIPDYKKNERAN